MPETHPGYFANLWNALLGRHSKAPTAPIEAAVGARASDEDTADLRAQLATLQADIQHRDGQIAEMRREYQQLQSSTQQATSSAGQEELSRLYRRLCQPLSNLLALAAMTDEGKELETSDLVELIRDLEKQFAKTGLQPICRTGEVVEFDVAIHESASGRTPADDGRVKVRIPGFTMGDKVLQKAIVSPEGD